jgi:hypothetical protein
MTRATKTVKKGVVPAAQVFAEARKRSGYAEAYSALEEEFSLVAALIKARTNSGLTQAELAERMSTTQAVIASRSRRPPPFDAHARAIGQGDRPPARNQFRAGTQQTPASGLSIRVCHF